MACPCLLATQQLAPTPVYHTESGLEQVLEHPKSPDFIDAAASGFTYDSLAGLDYLQYPHTEAFGMPSVHRTYLILVLTIFSFSYSH